MAETQSEPATTAPSSGTGHAETAVVILAQPTSPAAPATQPGETAALPTAGHKETNASEPESATTSSLTRPLASLAATLPTLLAVHPEVWGVALSPHPATHVPTQIILQKFLNANDQDVDKATDQLRKTLEWRGKMKPRELLERKFDGGKFKGLGYVTTYGEKEGKETEVFTWNTYGTVKDIEKTFGVLDDFIAWRVALMELALSSLDIASATTPITSDDIEDPYKITQVHDYKSISFLRQSSTIKAASTETIKVFAQNYPELLKEKYFLNVPALMSFIYGLIRHFVASKTARKFHPMADGRGLAAEYTGTSKTKVPGLGKMLPKEYGGEGAGLGEAGKAPMYE